MVGGVCKLIPHLIPVGENSTNLTYFILRMSAMDAVKSLGTTLPRYNKQDARYLPCERSHQFIAAD